MKNLKIAKVHWRDATHYRSEDRIDWLSENACDSEFITVGHVLKMGRKNIILAHEINDEDKARDTSVIPRSLVIKVEYLKSEIGG